MSLPQSLLIDAEQVRSFGREWQFRAAQARSRTTDLLNHQIRCYQDACALIERAHELSCTTVRTVWRSMHGYDPL